MKRILHVVSCLQLGGTEAFIMNNYRQLNRNDYQFDFMVFLEDEYPYTREIEQLGGRVYFCGTPSLKRLREFEKKAISLMVKNGPYDAVHSHLNIQNGIVLKAAYKAGISKRISHSHATSGKSARGIKYVYQWYKELLLRKYATDFLACSECAGKYLYGERLFAEKGVIIPNGINVNSFAGKETHSLKKEFEIPDNCSLVMGNITRFDQNKNPLFTVMVFKEMLRYYPQAILLLGGPDAGMLNVTKKMVDILEINGSVRFAGARKDVADCLKLLDIYLLPSLSEGLSIAFLEAQASGCLCVASTNVPRESSIVDSATMYLPLDEGAEYWAKKISDAVTYREKPKFEEIKKCFCDKNFDITSAHKRLLEVYDE